MVVTEIIENINISTLTGISDFDGYTRTWRLVRRAAVLEKVTIYYDRSWWIDIVLARIWDRKSANSASCLQEIVRRLQDYDSWTYDFDPEIERSALVSGPE